jgi:hypothetical protein
VVEFCEIIWGKLGTGTLRGEYHGNRFIEDCRGRV